MLATLQRQLKLMNAKISLLALGNAFLDPLLIILALLTALAWADESFDRRYVILALIVFSISFPGEPRHDKSLRAATLDIVIGWAGSWPSWFSLAMPATIWRPFRATCFWRGWC